MRVAKSGPTSPKKAPGGGYGGGVRSPRGPLPPRRAPAVGRGSGVTNRKQAMADRVAIAKKMSGGIGVAPKGSAAAAMIKRHESRESRGKSAMSPGRMKEGKQIMQKVQQWSSSPKNKELIKKMGPR